ncbi:MAG: DUF362 domain-containing protein [Acidobacteria bacterium]|jgi:uncharacterized protein (DUF362 family)|nr:DUF362 domain-containing protein [Acidobacteriota bacterium]
MREKKKKTMDRRGFIKNTAIGLAFLPAMGFGPAKETENKKTAKIALIKTSDRAGGIQEALRIFEFPSVRNKKVFIKPNFNTSDPPPGSTHNDTLTKLILELRNRGAGEITVGDRSGPQETKDTLEKKGIFQLAEKHNFKLINFEELPPADWVKFNPPGNHWDNGFSLARPVVEAEYLVYANCLKTHQYGGVFTMSLKLTVGVAPRSLMAELHSSSSQRKMIAELNQPFKPQLIVMDGIEAFVDGGPMRGTFKRADVIVVGDDRVAVDAVGLAILKELGTNKNVMDRKIFEQEQIARAVELGIGVSGPGQIEFVTADKAGWEYAQKLKAILANG